MNVLCMIVMVCLIGIVMSGNLFMIVCVCFLLKKLLVILSWVVFICIICNVGN